MTLARSHPSHSNCTFMPNCMFHEEQRQTIPLHSHVPHADDGAETLPAAAAAGATTVVACCRRGKSYQARIWTSLLQLLQLRSRPQQLQCLWWWVPKNASWHSPTKHPCEVVCCSRSPWSKAAHGIGPRAAKVISCEQLPPIVKKILKAQQRLVCHCLNSHLAFPEAQEFIASVTYNLVEYIRSKQAEVG